MTNEEQLRLAKLEAEKLREALEALRKAKGKARRAKGDSSSTHRGY